MLTQPLLADANDANHDNIEIDLEPAEKSNFTMFFDTLPLRNIVSSLKNFFHSLGLVLLPSFLHFLFKVPASNLTAPSLNSTYSNELDYLIGVRGFASIIVFVYHWMHGSFHETIDYAYGDRINTGSEPSELHHMHIYQLPLLRVCYAAEAMVALFFILSGFILSYQPAQQMRDQTPIAALSTHAFRRAPRLFLPALAATLLAFVLYLTDAITLPTKSSHSILGQKSRTLLDFLYNLIVSGIWTWETRPGPDWALHPHLWTVPTEWRCSMALFALLLSTASRKPSTRFVLEVCVTMWCLAAGRWDVALFTAGAALAELRVKHEAQDLPISRSRRSQSVKRITLWEWVCTATLTLTLLLGLLLAGYPRMPPSSSTPLYGPLAAVVSGREEGRRLFYALGAVLVLLSLDRLELLQKFFRSRVALYFGRISYALYLVHGLLVRSIGQWVLNTVWRIRIGGDDNDGKGDGLGFNAKFGLASALFIPVVVWVADLFERGVERRLVRWTKQL